MSRFTSHSVISEGDSLVVFMNGQEVTLSVTDVTDQNTVTGTTKDGATLTVENGWGARFTDIYKTDRPLFASQREISVSDIRIGDIVSFELANGWGMQCVSVTETTADSFSGLHGASIPCTVPASWVERITSVI